MKSLIIIGASGVGKGTIINHLLSRNKNLMFTMSFTTRQMRGKEVQGQHYYFITQEQFDRKQQQQELLQSKKVFRHYYGTSAKSYFDIINANKIPVLDIDVQGMLSITNNLKSLAAARRNIGDPEVVCVMPPSWLVLQRRLRGRGEESQEKIRIRLQQNLEQIKKMQKLRVDNINFVTNYQYQLTTYGIELLLKRKMPNF